MHPVVHEDIAGIRKAVREARQRGLRVGLVPTMGALHEGHASLLRAARAECGLVVASIFVNPTQFGPHEDFHRYPRPFEHDVALCTREQVDQIFHPAPEVLYPSGFRTYVEVHGWQDLLEGAQRPGHFRGVATVVLKLLNIVQPDLAYFGQKDAQQALVIRQMVRDLDLSVHIRICPIVREADGLALSSRNQYLDPIQRRHAVVLSQSLRHAQALLAAGERDAATVQKLVTAQLAAAEGAQVDYVAVVNADTLEPLTRLRGDVLIAIAVRFGSTRLLDNALFTGLA